MKNIICPVSAERVDENVVRLTAMQVVLLIVVFLIEPNTLIPLFLLVDFYIRAFTKAKSSPLSWISKRIVRYSDLNPRMIDKAPKIFAARVGVVFSAIITLLFLLNLVPTAMVVSSVLMLFAFLECGVNFCAGCWVYTYIVLPIYNDK